MDDDEFDAQSIVLVPVIVDSIPTDAETSVTRCVYFYMTAEDPNTQWALGRPPGIPFLMLGLQGILHRPSRSAGEFISAPLFRSLIKDIEANEGFAVETGCIWLPADLLRRAKKVDPNATAVERGDVFRIDTRVFLLGWGIANGTTNVTQFDDDLKGLEVGRTSPQPSIFFSRVETKSLSVWSEEEVLANQTFGQTP